MKIIFYFFYIDKQDISAESNISSLKGENRVIEKIDRDDLNIIIKKEEDGTEKLPTYIASWEYENTVYYLVGKIEIDELKKIVKEMKF